jgi:hypothetical protein
MLLWDQLILIITNQGRVPLLLKLLFFKDLLLFIFVVESIDKLITNSFIKLRFFIETAIYNNHSLSVDYYNCYQFKMINFE